MNKKMAFCALGVFLALGLQGPAMAAPKGKANKAAKVAEETKIETKTQAITTSPDVSPIETTAREVFLIDAATGTQLLNLSADVRMPTSSMSKVMTMYLVFEAIKSGKLTLDGMITVSEKAWRQEGSRMFMPLGSQVKVEDLVRGVIIQSGNDAAVALAEAVGGSEGAFAAMMNEKAQALGMTNSHFMNATGLPDPNHYSTARDLATLAIAMVRDFPDLYKYYSEVEFAYNGIKQGNRNPLLYKNIGADGMKTGHTADAGYGLIGTIKRDGRRLVLVVNGLGSMQDRADESAKLLEWGFREYGLYTLVKAGDKMADVPVYMGQAPSVPLMAAKEITVTIPPAVKNKVDIKVEAMQPLPAPVAKGAVVGKAIVTVPGMQVIEVPLVTGGDVPLLPFMDRMIFKVKRLLGKA